MSWVQLRLFEVPEDHACVEPALQVELAALLPGPGHEVTVLSLVDTLLDHLAAHGLFPARVRVEADMGYIDPDCFQQGSIGDL